MAGSYTTFESIPTTIVLSSARPIDYRGPVVERFSVKVAGFGAASGLKSK